MEITKIGPDTNRKPHSEKYPFQTSVMTDDQLMEAHSDDHLLCSTCNRFFPVVGPNTIQFTSFIDPFEETHNGEGWNRHVAEGCPVPVNWVPIPDEDPDTLDEAIKVWTQLRTVAILSAAKEFASRYGVEPVKGGTVLRFKTPWESNL